MNLGTKQMKIGIALTLVAILLGQGVWIYNMFQTYRYQIFQAVDQAIEVAILKEYTIRHEKMGGTIVSVPLSNDLDTARYIKRTVRLKDTTFQVTFDRNDPYSENKLAQYILKDVLPLNITVLDSFFRKELVVRGFPNAETYVEYIDLISNKILDNSLSNSTSMDGYQMSGIKNIDIFGTLGIKAFAKIPVSSVLNKMLLQLILSVLLVSFCVFFLFTIIRTFFWKEKVEAMRKESINTLTHEFKRPISSAVAQVSLIPYYLKKENPDKASQYAENTLLELNKLTAYTERIQSISKGTEPHLALNRVSVYLPDFFKRVKKKYAETPEKKIDLDVKFNSKLEYFTMDLLHMSNVLDNLIENAIKYSKDHLKIDLDVQDGKEGLLIRVKDNGIGIAKTEVTKVFDRYFRSSNVQQTNANGFGLGLTYCKLVVEEHGGSISVESKLGSGSMFSVILPVSEI